MKLNVKRASLVMNIIAIVVTCAILIGATFAWFTDSVTSTGNKIQAGTLKVDLELLDKEQGWKSLKDDNAPIFDYDKWEPGYTDIKILKVENEGSLALQWKAKFVTTGTLSALADVIDVYVLPSETELTYPENRNLDGYWCVGTLAQFINTLESTTRGTLLAGEVAYLGLALKMQTNAGNEYQGLALGNAFDIMIVATQLSSENDGFNSEYDNGASLNFTTASTPNQLRLALSNKERNIMLTDNIIVDDTFTVDYNANINGNGYKVSRTASAQMRNVPYTATVFNVATNASLTLTDIIVDGGAVWSGERDAVLNRGTENSGVTATGALISAGNNAQIVLGEGAVIQNNAGATAINLGMRIGATLTIDGGEVINNESDAGAIWGGGHITFNSGKINYNSSTGIAGAIRMVSNCNFTMNGGEMSFNKATTTGGAIYGYGVSKLYFNGGTIEGNSAQTAGVIWTGEGSTIVMKDGAKIINNTAEEVGALRLCSTTFIMEGGLISGNVSTNQPAWNGSYGWNSTVNFKGGEVNDAFYIDGGTIPTVGGDGVNGVIYFALSTNHNTCNLLSSFGTIKFMINEGDNFFSFNFKPESSYEYTEGDEDKLICLNEGYETYYDTTSKTFRIKASN